ncbi:hypothetical protein [Serinibacter salmoneus]|uniref:Uncharacterized protein n=1 Tax=Serinibacter salmoneus TaxID=556530 RepID=A0A2A9D510_9MICO|nr:hypothetical protein [Serinibacter salmoneus]PFG20940.1 hypothetical protein ATL40_2557 [Serinibacter salmoneus]
MTGRHAGAPGPERSPEEWAELTAHEIATDRRAERRLPWQALTTIAVVTLVAWFRQVIYL